VVILEIIAVVAHVEDNAQCGDGVVQDQINKIINNLIILIYGVVQIINKIMEEINLIPLKII